MTDEATVRTVSLTVRVPDDVAVGEHSVLRARVEESSVADRAPNVVARAEVPVESLPASHQVQVDLEVAEGLIDPTASYTVFCHLDTTGSGEVEVGDALSSQVVPVLTPTTPVDRVSVELRRV